MIRTIPWLVVTAAGLGVALSAGPAAADDDCEGCRDLPYFSRLPSYSLGTADEVEFDAYKFPDGKQLTEVEGRLFKRHYNLKEGAVRASPLQIRRNYANAARKAGGSVLFDGLCEAESCEQWQSWQFLTGTLSYQGKNIIFQVIPHNEGANYEIIAMERGEMKQDVVVNADAMRAELADKGHIALYIAFDANKAVIKNESLSVVEEIAKLLTADPEMKLSIEGHSDATGDAALATKLSLERAQAVLTALVKKGVEKSRCKTVGWGPKKPLDTTNSEAGNARNRRVELVRIDS